MRARPEELNKYFQKLAEEEKRANGENNENRK